jgi:MFS family permease
MLDSMDVMLYAMVLPAVQKELHMSSGLSGAMMSATLVAAAVGGIFFGWFADRMGRTRALNASMLLYSVATMLCGFTHTALALAACRILLGLRWWRRAFRRRIGARRWRLCRASGRSGMRWGRGLQR